ncbi:MAG: hypothetical protein EOP04_11850, partial [Proteobacteria bacterium]
MSKVVEWILNHLVSTAFLLSGVVTLIILIWKIVRNEAKAKRDSSFNAPIGNIHRKKLPPKVSSKKGSESPTTIEGSKPDRPAPKPSTVRNEQANTAQSAPNVDSEHKGNNAAISPPTTTGPKASDDPVTQDRETKANAKPDGKKFIWAVASDLSECVKPGHYPVVRFPEIGTPLIRPVKKIRQGSKGRLEEKFMLQLQEFLGLQLGKVDVSTQHSLQKPNGFFEPDFVLVANGRGNPILLDVEIDEPYAGDGSTVTHCIGKDDIRNEYFLKAGWIVVRFAEVQVVRQPMLCCQFIFSVVQAVTHNVSICSNTNLRSLITIPYWDDAQAEAWQREMYREKYLGITSFGTGSQKPSNDVNEIEDGELAEASSLPTMDITPPPKKAKGLVSEVPSPGPKASGTVYTFRFIPHETKEVDFKGTNYLRFKLADRYN